MKVAIPTQTIAEFCNHWQVTELALFGSVLRDDFRPDSDIDIILSYTAHCPKDEFVANVQLQDAVIRRLLVIAEAAKRVSDSTRQTLPHISWQELNGMRNRLVHEYDDINLNIVWDVIQDQIPA